MTRSILPILLLGIVACSARVLPKPPPGMAFLKIPMCRLGGDCSFSGDNCHISFKLCRLNGQPLPEPKPWTSLGHEVNSRGHYVSYLQRYTIAPGAQELVVTGRGALRCEDESRVTAYIGELLLAPFGGGLAGAAQSGSPLGAIPFVGGIARVVADSQREGPLVVQFEAKPGETYMLGCSSNPGPGKPWVWIIPEEEW